MTQHEKTAWAYMYRKYTPIHITVLLLNMLELSKLHQIPYKMLHKWCKFYQAACEVIYLKMWSNCMCTIATYKPYFIGGYSVIVALTGLPIGYSVIVALTGLPIGYSVIVALTGLPIGYSVIVALTGLPIGYSVAL